MAAKTKPQPAASTTRVSLDPLRQLIAPFGWSIDENGCRLFTPSDLAMFINWCSDESAEQEAAPEAIWKLIDVPYDQRKAFRNDNDVRALLCTLLTYRQDFLSMAAHPDHALELLADNICINGGKTSYGAIYLETEPLHGIWFGKKAGQLPAFSGLQVNEALNKLLNVAVTAPRDEPATNAVEKPKSTARRMVAKKETPAAEQQSGARNTTSQPKGSSRRSVTATEKPPLARRKEALEIIDIDCIEPDPQNDRKEFDAAALQELADSIVRHGVLQPILLRPIHGRNAFAIIAGERRWRAAKLAGLTEIPAQISDREGLQVSLARLDENLKRVDLSPIEKAQALQRMMEVHGLKQTELGQLVGVQQGQISNMLRLLNLPKGLQAKVADGTLKPTLVRALLPYADVPAMMDDALNQLNNSIAENDEITIDSIETMVHELVQKHSRCMVDRSKEQINQWQKPSQTNRYFGKIDAEEVKQLDVRKIENRFGQKIERAFNLELFHQLNKEPFKKKLDKHKAAQPKSSSKPANGKKSDINYFADGRYTTEREIDKQLQCDVAKLIDRCKDAAAVQRVVTIVALISEDGIVDELCGKWSPENSVKLFKVLTGTPKEIQAKLRTAVVSLLNGTRCSFGVNELSAIAKALGTELLSKWIPNAAVLLSLNSAGLETCAQELGIPTETVTVQTLMTAWPPGYVPEFLHACLGVAKPTKNGKAA